LTFQIAKEIHRQVPDTKEVYVWLLSKIGQPIDQPTVAAVQIIPEKRTSFDKIRGEAEKVVDEELGNINEFCMDLAMGKMPIC
jgi:S-adenosylmethionine synthetase